MGENKRIKVLFLPKWYPNKFDVLDGVFVVDHAKAVHLKHDLYVLFVHSDPTLKIKKTVEFSQSNGYPELIIYFKVPKTKFGVFNQLITGLHYLKYQFYGYRLIRKKWGKHTVSHVHVLLRTSFLALWLKWTNKIPYLITEHWSGYDSSVGYPISRLKKFWLRYIIKRSTGITTVSSYLSDHIRCISDQKPFHIVSNCVDDGLFYIREKPQDTKTKIIHISTLDDYPKNFGEILSVIGTLSEKRDDFEFHAIGKGIEVQLQQERATKLGILNKTVFFRGYLPKEVIAKELAESDLMLLFSHYETQSCVLLESFLSGVPAIASNVGGVSEIVTKSNGMLVNRNDSKGLLESLEMFLNGTIIFDKEEIRASAMRYGYSEIGQKFGEIYSQILEKK
jgi:glycosyltransferase involved in cell wall biosynthesis